VKTTGKIFLFFFLLTALPAASQVKFSLASDASLLRNFDDRHSFTVVGQGIHGQWHLGAKNTLYVWLTYHRNGKYKSDLSAVAKSATTLPQTVSFISNSEMRLRQLSAGIKHYLVGSYNRLEKFSLYGAAGFGLIFGRATNNFSVAVDTSLYTVQGNILNGSGDFKRLSFDLTAGWEIPVSYEIFVFSEARIHIPASSYPNNYLLKNDNAPFLGSINIGFRILFNNDN
jgi:hypothetical protein